MTQTETLDIIDQTVKTAKPKRARKPRVPKVKAEGAEVKAKKKGIKKSEKSKQQNKIAPSICSYRLYKQALKNAFENGDLTSKFKLSHDAKIALDDKIAAYNIQLFDDASSITRGVRGAGTLSGIDIYATLALRPL